MFQTENPKSKIVELPYLPCVAFFAAVWQAEEVRLEVCEHFPKQTHRNRTYLLGANGVVCLTVPVRHKDTKQPMRDVKIDYDQRWANVHWRTIASAYGKSPFFDYYAPELESVFTRQSVFLLDLNEELLTICLSFLQKKIQLTFTQKYEPLPLEGFQDLRNRISAEKRGEVLPFFEPVPYIQNFGKEFVSNLSILDLLFSEGNFASDIIRQSIPDKSGEQIGR
jgi:hypothetical protein